MNVSIKDCRKILKIEGKLVLIIFCLPTFATHAPTHVISADPLHFGSYHVGQRRTERGGA
jgi:hypothetical protein